MNYVGCVQNRQQYLYRVCKEQSSLPEEGLAMIRYHSFYPWHREGAYTHLMEEKEFVLPYPDTSCTDITLAILPSKLCAPSIPMIYTARATATLIP